MPDQICAWRRLPRTDYRSAALRILATALLGDEMLRSIFIGAVSLHVELYVVGFRIISHEEPEH
jgi:hypothetical protein